MTRPSIGQRSAPKGATIGALGHDYQIAADDCAVDSHFVWSRVIARCEDQYVEPEADRYWMEPSDAAYEVVHQIGANTYEESFAVPSFNSPMPYEPNWNDHLRQQFEDLRDAWFTKSARMGVVRDMVLVPEYQRIIGLGQPAVPLIIDSLRKRPHHWFWALRAITGENPAAGSTTLQEATERWISWYDAH
jgi:hypothetical protein